MYSLFNAVANEFMKIVHYTVLPMFVILFFIGVLFLFLDIGKRLNDLTREIIKDFSRKKAKT